MTELEQLKERINQSGFEGIETSIIREDYEPAGNLMIHHLMETGDYVSYKVPPFSYQAIWKVFKKGMEPY